MRRAESREDYLETILMLKNEVGAVRSIDIANRMGFSKPSVSRAVGLLKSAGQIEVDHEGFIELTPSGKEEAERVYERHTLLTEYLVSIGVSREIAAEDACGIEHVISAESFEKLKEHVMSERHQKKVASLQQQAAE